MQYPSNFKNDLKLTIEYSDEDFLAKYNAFRFDYLSQTERFVLAYRYEHDHTFPEIAERLGYSSRQRVFQVYKTALNKTRRFFERSSGLFVLGLPPRVETLLSESGYDTVDKILSASSRSLLSIPRFGATSLRILDSRLSECGYRSRIVVALNRLSREYNVTEQQIIKIIRSHKYEGRQFRP